MRGHFAAGKKDEKRDGRTRKKIKKGDGKDGRIPPKMPGYGLVYI